MGFALTVDSVWKAFGDRAVLKGASVWARPGRVGLLLGSNGSGKSTLLRCAVGAERWDQGGVFVAGHRAPPDLVQLSRLGLFYWPDGGLLSRRRTVGWHLAAVRKSRRTNGTGPVETSCGRFEDRLPDELSGGERRRCELALVEAAEPRVLLADEPLLGIAPSERTDLCRALRALADRGCAVLVTGHEVEDLLDLAASRTTLLGVPPIVFAIVLLDQRACRESVILGNLGVPFWLAPAVGGGVALALEVVAVSVWS